MKKIVLSLAAVFSFGIAAAQVPPGQPAQTPDAVNTVTDPDTKAKKDADIQNNVVNPAAAPLNDPEPRKAEIKTRNHVKSTPDPSIANDTVTNKRKTAKRKRS